MATQNLSSSALAGSLLDSIGRHGLATSTDPLSLAQAIQLAIRSAHLYGVDRLQHVESAFPANIQGLLELPDAAIDFIQEAFIGPDDYLDFVDLLDLISDEHLDCIAPHLHRGWKDKTQSCRDARKVAGEVLGYSVGESFRSDLLKAVAIRERVFGIPGPLLIDTAQLEAAFHSVLELIERIAPSKEALELKPLLAQLLGK